MRKNYEQNISALNKQNEELRRTVSNYEQNTSRLSKEVEELRRVLQDHGDLQRVVNEYDHQVRTLKQEL